MRKLSGLIVLLVLVATGCGGGATGGDGADLGEDVFEGIGQASGDVDPGDEGLSGGGTLENPTPEASSSLPSDSIRIGDTAWERTMPTDGGCSVEEESATLPASGSARGSVNNDPGVEFSVSHRQDGSVEAQVQSNLMNWISGVKDGTELTIQLDFETNTISGEGLFYNGHTNEWAYGSFTFTCSDGG